MPWFGTSSPFDVDVEKATSELNTQEDWSVIMNICDKVSRTPNGPRDCLKSLTKRLQSKIPHVCLQTLTLLDACINNCGKDFRVEVSSRDFVTEVRNIIANKNTHQKVQQKIKSYIKKWAESAEFKNDPSLDILVNLYKTLKAEGHDFTDGDTNVTTTARQPNAVDAALEEKEIAKAIQLSLQETERHKAAVTTAASLYPTMFDNTTGHYTTVDRTPQPHRTEARNVRALYDFEAAEDNELTFKAGEIVTVLDDSDPNWWKGYNHGGEGLFPANFVSADLTFEPPDEKKKVQFNDVVNVKTVAPIPVEVVEINEEKIDLCLKLLENADPTGETSPDTPEMLHMEEQCKAMGPLIDAELEKIDTMHANLVGVNVKVMKALQLYHLLMRESYGGIPKNVPGYIPAASTSMPPQTGMYTAMPQATPDPAAPQAVPANTPLQPGPVVPPAGPVYASTDPNQFPDPNVNQSAITVSYPPNPAFQPTQPTFTYQQTMMNQAPYSTYSVVHPPEDPYKAVF